MTFTIASHVPHSDELISCLYTSASVNRHSGCISALTVRAPTGGSTSLLAFGSSHAICLSVAVLAQRGSDDTTGLQLTVPMFRVLRVLHGHDALVVAVRWIPSPDPSYERSPHRFLVSLDTTGKLLLWGCRMNDVISTDSINRPRCSMLLELRLPSGCTPNAVDGCIVTCRMDPQADLVQLLLNVAADTALYSWYTKLSIGAHGLSVLWTSDAVIIEHKPAMCLCVRSVSWALMAQQSPSTFENSSLHVVFVGLDNGNIEVWSEHISRLPPSSTIEPRKFVHSATLFGHTDWIRCLDICTQLEGFTPVAFLVSGAQDHIVRLWRLYSPDGLCSLSKEDWSTLKVAELHLPERVKLKLCIASESVLSSHENWITGVSWEKSTSVSASFPPALLSSSMDRSLIVWMPPSQQQFTGAGDEPHLWLEEIRVGVVGGTGLGFLDCDWFSSDLTGRSFIGQNFQGSISLWSREENTSTWSPGLPLCGHSGPVTDLSWSRISSITSDSILFGIPPRVLLTAGADQTVRAHVPCRERATPENPSASSSNSKQFVWQEIARPQVHGYEMNAVAWLSSTSYVSASDEKVARVFKATRNFFSSYEQFSGAQCIPSDRSLAVVAVQPTLGLSNQVASLDACENEVEEVCDNNLILHSTPLPTEDRLQHATLWPEMKKLYGHAYEVYCLAAHPQLMLVASACVAAKPQHAFIILWNGYTDWTIHARLTHHQLTVTQLIWSPGGRYLLAVSRDRTWSVWRGVEQKIGENVACPIAPPIYNLFAYPTKGKGHSRIIWTGAWSSDERYFFTGSRDKSILAWNISETDATVPISCVPLEARHTCPEAVTALDVVGLTPTNGQWEYLMAVGLESGQLQLLLLHAINPDQSSSLTRILWSQPILFSPELCHVKNKRVRRVAFEPLIQSNQRTLSSAADDGLVRLFSINIEQLQNNML